jgi:outer membrane receptor protein involved in Fe transport
MRTDYFTMLRKAGVSPRAGLRFEFSQGTAEAGVSAGMEYQYPSYAEDYFITRHGATVALQRSYDAVLSCQKQIAGDVIAAIEAYYKYGDREPLYAIVDHNRELIADFERYGRKKTYGIEMSLQKKRHDWFFYQLGYTYFDSRLEYRDGNWYNADLNLHNAGTALVGSALNKYHSLSLRLDLAEGSPYTPVDEALSKQRYSTMYDVGEGWNSRRREARVDLGVRYDLSIYLKRCTVTAYVEVQNLLGRRYVISEELRQGRKYGDGYIYQCKSRGIFPVGGLMVDF